MDTQVIGLVGNLGEIPESDFGHTRPGKRSHSDCWDDIPMFNRKLDKLASSIKGSIFQPAMLDYRSAFGSLGNGLVGG